MARILNSVSYCFARPSEHKFGGIPSTHRSGSPNNAKVYSLCPASSRWAKWNPKAPYHLEYEPSKLKFEDVTFNDVEVVGWVSSRYRNDGPAACWLKWAGFDVHATVTRPWRVSEHVNMVKVPASDGELYMSETEIDFRTWRKISNWSFKQVWAHMPTYVYGSSAKTVGTSQAQSGSGLPGIAPYAPSP